MKVIHPTKKAIIIWNTLAIAGGLVFGDSGYVYTALAMFLAVALFSFKYDFKENNGSTWNYFLIGAFALFNASNFGPIGLNLTIIGAVNMYILYFAIIPMIKGVKSSYQTYSNNNKGENHE